MADLYQIQIPAEVLDEHLGKNVYGKPYLKDYPQIHFNISHGKDIAICAISNEPVGADVEKIHDFNPLILRKVLTDAEKEFWDSLPEDEKETWFYRFWTLKEARIKHAGMGLSMSLTSFSFHFDLEKEPYHIQCSDTDVYFKQLILEKQYVLSLCSKNHRTELDLTWL